MCVGVGACVGACVEIDVTLVCVFEIEFPTQQEISGVRTRVVRYACVAVQKSTPRRAESAEAPKPRTLLRSGGAAPALVALPCTPCILPSETLLEFRPHILQRLAQPCGAGRKRMRGVEKKAIHK